MSTADTHGTVVVWREPFGVTARRLGRRMLLPTVAAVGWALDLATWAVVIVSVAAAPSAILLLFGLINLALRWRVTLVHTPDGALLWPRSIQEVLLGREADHVVGERVEVLKEIPSLAGTRADPRVTFTAGERSFGRFPLHGTDVDAFVDRANEVLEGRGMRLERVHPPAPPEEESRDDPAHQLDVAPIQWPDDTSPDYDPDEPPDETPWRPKRD